MEIVSEIVIWDDVEMLRDKFDKNKNDYFEIPDKLYKRWKTIGNEFWSIQNEIKKYKAGELIY